MKYLIKIIDTENLPFECLHSNLSNGKINAKNVEGEFIIETERLFSIFLALGI